MAATATVPKAALDQLRQEEAGAATERESAHAALTATVTRWNDARSRVDRNIGGVQDLPTASLEEILNAKAILPSLEVEVVTRQLSALRADQRYDEAVAARKTAQRAEITVRKRVAVAKVARALLAARGPVDELAQIEEAESNALGPHQGERLASAWSTLMTGTPTRTSLLDHWTATLRADGLLDEQ